MYANVGQSEILQVGVQRRFEDIGSAADTGSIKRLLIKFGSPAESLSLSEVSDLITSQYISSSALITSSIRMYHAYSDTYSSTYKYEVRALTSSWQEGDGFNLEATSETYDEGEASWTQSDSSTYWTYPGGVTSSAYLFQVTHSVGDQDFVFDVTSVAKDWIDETLNNHGLLVKVDNEAWTTASKMKNVYSRHTNTIYQPVLEVTWDDRIRDDRNGIVPGSSDNKLYYYNRVRGQYTNIDGLASGNNCMVVKFTQAASASNTTLSAVSASWIRKGLYVTDSITIGSTVTASIYDHWYSASTLISSGTCSISTSSLDYELTSDYDYFVLTLPDLDEHYINGNHKPVEVFARDKYPSYTYSTSSIIEQNSIPLYNASYSLFDYQTNEALIEYSKFTALSYDGNKNWFDFWFTALPLNRALYFGIKYEQNGVLREEKIKKTFTVREIG